MNPEQIRSTFFDFFGDRGHLLLPPSSVLSGDDSLLFTNAGMNQFKPYYLGERPPPGRRLMTGQPCVRTVDIDNIGYTMRHSTSFEMLGNFAFSDYFKLESMSWALELLTEGYGLERDRLHVTVFETDDESFDLWRRLGLPTGRIQRLGLEDNYWSMGVPGPSGPNSEIFYDRGPSFGRERYLELWNLVFMQHLRGNSDEEILGDLPGRHVDTGLGLSRVALVLQGKQFVQELDPLLDKVRTLTGRDDSSPSLRIIVDHLRTASVLLSTGLVPGNEGRGYVLRRLLRRAIRHLHLLGVTEPTVGRLIESDVAVREERVFLRTLVNGQKLLHRCLDRGSLTPEVVFKLHETHGFPVDLTEEIALERGVKVDRHRFNELMEAHRHRSR